MLQLYSYYRSTAAYRVRIALNYKSIPYEIIPINLLLNENLNESYLLHNKQKRVPTLVDGDFEVGQSSAILEYLEEKYPQPALLPNDFKARAWVRYLAQIIISDMHPLNNISVLRFLKDPLKHEQSDITLWYHHWLKQGFDALESILVNHPDCKNFCYGSVPTLADLCLIPQIYNANRFEFSMDAYPTLQRINKHCLLLPYFEQARPENQVDYQI